MPFALKTKKKIYFKQYFPLKVVNFYFCEFFNYEQCYLHNIFFHYIVFTHELLKKELYKLKPMLNSREEKNIILQYFNKP